MMNKKKRSIASFANTDDTKSGGKIAMWVGVAVLGLTAISLLIYFVGWGIVVVILILAAACEFTRRVNKESSAMALVCAFAISWFVAHGLQAYSDAIKRETAELKQEIESKRQLTRKAKSVQESLEQHKGVPDATPFSSDRGSKKNISSSQGANGKDDMIIQGAPESPLPDIASEQAQKHFNLALACYDKGESDKAIADYTEAIRLDPKFVMAYNNRGFTWHAKGESDKAIADYTEAIRLDPKFVKAYVNRGNAWAAKGEFAKAAKDAAKAELLKDLQGE